MKNKFAISLVQFYDSLQIIDILLLLLFQVFLCVLVHDFLCVIKWKVERLIREFENYTNLLNLKKVKVDVN